MKNTILIAGLLSFIWGGFQYVKNNELHEAITDVAVDMRGNLESVKDNDDSSAEDLARAEWLAARAENHLNNTRNTKYYFLFFPVALGSILVALGIFGFRSESRSNSE